MREEADPWQEVRIVAESGGRRRPPRLTLGKRRKAVQSKPKSEAKLRTLTAPSV